MANDIDKNKSKKRASASNAILFTLFTVGAVVVVNLIGTRLFGRVDLTEAKMYTISPGSKSMVADLPDYVNTKVFISEDLPPELKSVGRYVRDLVDEYASSSKGKFRWEAIDPGNDEKKKQDASSCQVEPLQVQVLREGKFEVGVFYLGLCMQYGDKTEAVPQIARPEGLEYQMTSLLKKMVKGRRKIAFTTGHGEIEPSQGLQSLKESLEAEYETTTVNPSSAEIGADIDALIVAGPKQAFDDKGQREIDKFFMRGKGGVLLVDGTVMASPGQNQFNMGGPQIQISQPNTTGLEPLLEAYGFKLKQEFVFEPEQMAPGPVQFGGTVRLGTMPYYVVAGIEEQADLGVVAGLRGVILPFPSSLERTGPLKDNVPQGAKLWTIAKSTPAAWRHSGFFTPQPTNPPTPSGERGPFDFGYAYQGPLKSAFPGTAPAAPAEGQAAPPANESAKPVRLVVLADSDFANDQYVGLARHPLLMDYDIGRALLFNAISWTIEDEGLTPLRNKTLTPRPLKIESQGKADALKWFNIIGLPLAFCAFGMVRFFTRRARRRAMAL